MTGITDQNQKCLNSNGFSWIWVYVSTQWLKNTRESFYCVPVCEVFCLRGTHQDVVHQRLIGPGVMEGRGHVQVTIHQHEQRPLETTHRNYGWLTENSLKFPFDLTSFFKKSLLRLLVPDGFTWTVPPSCCQLWTGCSLHLGGFHAAFYPVSINTRTQI